MPNYNKKKKFTMIEVVIAIAILSALINITFGSFISNSLLSLKNDQLVLSKAISLSEKSAPISIQFKGKTIEIVQTSIPDYNLNTIETFIDEKLFFTKCE
jgi:prepilin-type N-terminal cleavage/methylation domain-containing protein